MNLKEYLIEKHGYDPKNVDLMVGRLEALTDEFKMALYQWVETEEPVSPGEYFGYTVTKLMQEHGMNYPAALTTLDWIARNGEKAVREIEKGIK